jgi:serine/threonine-protein kinase
MYEMVTGRVPFDGDTTVSIAIKHLQEEIVPPSIYTPDLPYSLEQVILKCTQKNPDRRYQNVGELIDDLKKSLIDPQGNFVVISPLASHAETVRMSEHEMNEIRRGMDNKERRAAAEERRREEE